MERDAKRARRQRDGGGDRPSAMERDAKRARRQGDGRLSAMERDGKRARQWRIGRDDRLSALEDAILIRILSLLPTIDSVRTSALSRRWGTIYTKVPVVDFRSTPSSPIFLNTDIINAVLLTHDGAVPIRSLRIAGFRARPRRPRPRVTDPMRSSRSRSRVGGVRDRPSNMIIDQWIYQALKFGAETLELDLSKSDSDTLCFYYRKLAWLPIVDLYGVTPRVFTHAALRHLRLGSCSLALPKQLESLSLGSLETLSLFRIMAPEHILQLLISSCPALTNLTLEECMMMTRIQVPPAALLLRSFTIRCCHNADQVLVNAPSVRFLEYKGCVPHGSPFLLTSSGLIESLVIDICECYGIVEFMVCTTEHSQKISEVVAMVESCINLKSLCLSAQYSPPYFPYRPQVPWLTRLELRGPFKNCVHITTLIGVLRNTSNLEVLTLVIDAQADEASTLEIVVPEDLLSSEIQCLSHSLRRPLKIYCRSVGQRQLAKFLLRKAVCTQEMHVTFAESVVQTSEIQTLLVDEMMQWWRNPEIKINFTRGCG